MSKIDFNLSLKIKNSKIVKFLMILIKRNTEETIFLCVYICMGVL